MPQDAGYRVDIRVFIGYSDAEGWSWTVKRWGMREVSQAGYSDRVEAAQGFSEWLTKEHQIPLYEG